MKGTSYLSARVRRMTHFLRLRGPLAADPAAQMFHIFLVVVGIWMTVSIIATLRDRRAAWLVATFAAMITLNGLLHAVATAAFSTYSPGTITGLLVFVPLGSVTLFSMSRRLPRRQFVLATLGGVAFHAFVLFIAFCYS